MTDEIDQQIKLFRCEAHFLAAHQDLVAWKINLEIADTDFLLLRFGRGEAPKVSSDSRQLFIPAESLADIVVGASVEGFDFRALLTAHSEHDDGGCRFSPYSSREVNAPLGSHR